VIVRTSFYADGDRADDRVDVAQLVHVGRQPIYTLDREVYGYELLFRNGVQTAADLGGTYATSQVILNAFTEFGVSQLAGDRLCFLNLTRHFLVGELPLPFGAEQVVLEVLETVAVDDEVTAGVLDLVARGYRIALDDFVLGGGHERLLDVASFVKLDLLGTDPDHLRRIVQTCRAHPHVRLVAERVETAAQLAFARQLGCDLIQGYLLGRPQVLSTQALSASRLGRVQLTTALLRPEVEIDEVVSLVTRDPALSFRLLSATNSAAAGLHRKVSSVHEAVVLLGTGRVREWVSLMALADLSDADDAYLAGAVGRARMCQLVAELLGGPGAPAFTAGLLLGVADLLGVSVDALVEKLPLAADLVEALVDGEGELGRVLEAVRAYELLERPPGGWPVPMVTLSHAYLAATGWSTRAVEGVLGQHQRR
jgi:EAL and modified HD-GYP domain-containing signal transduction protein